LQHRSRLSSKGQVTIPIEVRARLGLEAGDVVVYEIEGERVTLRRADPFDIAYHASLSQTLDEWSSAEDDEAFDGL
jgi:AbrB family looped-hinge helix DNA binding protein